MVLLRLTFAALTAAFPNIHSSLVFRVREEVENAWLELTAIQAVMISRITGSNYCYSNWSIPVAGFLKFMRSWDASLDASVLRVGVASFLLQIEKCIILGNVTV